MPLHLYSDIYSSGSVPQEWQPLKGGILKYPALNKSVLRELRRLLTGRWKKVIKQGNKGEVHYFEHKSGSVAGVKFIAKRSGT